MGGDIFYQITVTLWLILPSFFANSSALLVGGKYPMDFYKEWRGERVFGKGKTWRGFFGGIFFGSLLGFLQEYSAIHYISFIVPPFSYDIYQATLIIITMSSSAMIGDLLGSFIKRRLKYKSGSNLPIIDQLTFLFFTLFMLLIVTPSFFFEYFFSLEIFLILIIFTYIIHRAANIIGYLIGKKGVPW
jgi:CDP-2,3-bis-(O-geranylgeranyl)-sn-glycerol synthase